MKNLIKATIIVTALYGNASSSEIGVVKTWSTSIRDNPTHDSTIFNYAKMGKYFKIDSYNDEWYILKNGKFINKNNLTPMPSLETFDLVVKKNGANIRTRPFVSKKTLIRKAKGGEILKGYLLLKNGWYALTNDELVYSGTVSKIKKSVKPTKIVQEEYKPATIEIPTKKEKIEIQPSKINNDAKYVSMTTKKAMTTLSDALNNLKKKIDNNSKQLKNLKTKNIPNIFPDSRNQLTPKEIGVLRNNLLILKDKNAERKNLYFTKRDILVREKKELNSKRVATISKNRIVEVVDIKGNRALLLEGGYVSIKYLEELSNKISDIETLRSSLEDIEKSNKKLKSIVNTKVSKNELKEVSRITYTNTNLIKKLQNDLLLEKQKTKKQAEDLKRIIKLLNNNTQINSGDTYKKRLKSIEESVKYLIKKDNNENH